MNLSLLLLTISYSMSTTSSTVKMAAIGYKVFELPDVERPKLERASSKHLLEQ